MLNRLRVECDAFYDRKGRVYRVYHCDGTRTRHTSQQSVMDHMDDRAEALKAKHSGEHPCDYSVQWHGTKRLKRGGIFVR